MKLTLPTDSQERKDLPVVGGCRNYFPAALAGVARWSKLGNDKHNPGEPLHHARGKSSDHEECIERHSMDLADILAAIERLDAEPNVYNEERARLIDMALDEYDARCWRALAASQEFREKHGLAPLAPAARLPEPESIINWRTAPEAIGGHGETETQPIVVTGQWRSRPNGKGDDAQ